MPRTLELFFSIARPNSLAEQIDFYNSRFSWLPQTEDWPGLYPILPVYDQSTVDLQHIIQRRRYVTQAHILGPMSYAPISVILGCFRDFYSLAAMREEVLETTSTTPLVQPLVPELPGSSRITGPEDLEAADAADDDPYFRTSSSRGVTIF